MVILFVPLHVCGFALSRCDGGAVKWAGANSRKVPDNYQKFIIVISLTTCLPMLLEGVFAN